MGHNKIWLKTISIKIFSYFYYVLFWIKQHMVQFSEIKQQTNVLECEHEVCTKQFQNKSSYGNTIWQFQNSITNLMYGKVTKYVTLMYGKLQNLIVTVGILLLDLKHL